MTPNSWDYDPHSGGIKIPDREKERIRLRILRHAETHYAGKYLRIKVRFRAQFCYIDAYTEPQLPPDYDPQILGVSREKYIEQIRNTPTHLCRLRYFGKDRWSMSFYTYSHEKYEPCLFNNGDWIGSPEQAFDTAAVYLTD